MNPLEVTVLIYIVLILFVWFWLPAACLLWVATHRGRGVAWALWGLLGWIGLAIGLVMLLTATRLEEEPVVAPTDTATDAAERLRTLGELREQGLLTDSEFEERRSRVLEQL